MPSPTSLSTLAQLLTVTALTCVLPAQWAGEWHLDETTGTTANDVSGNGNHGTLNGFSTTPSPWVTGKVNNALSFDGVDDHVSLPIGKKLPLTYASGTPFTVTYWIKAPAQANKFVYAEGPNATSALVIFGSGQYAAQNQQFRTYARNDQGKWVFQGLSSVVVYDDTWHHIALVGTADKFKLYVDGVEDTKHSVRYNPATTPGTASYGTFTTNTATIGCLVRGAPGFFTKGVIDDLRIYNFAVSAVDVKLMMVGLNNVTCSSSIGKYGLGCNGKLDITATGSASFNQTMTLQLTGGTPNAPAMLLAGLPVATVDLTAAGFPGCFAYTPLTGLLVSIGALNSTGSSAQLKITIPGPSGSINCVVAVLQGVALAAKLELSPAILAQIGK
jgi:hypothetical protein